MFIKLRI